VSEKNGVFLGSSLLGIVGVVVLVGLIYFGIIAQYQIGGAAAGSAEVAENIKPIGSVRLVGDEPAAPAPQAEAAGADDPMALAQSSGCLGCHQVDTKLVGPAYKDVAAKYKGDAGALELLSAKVKSGGVGTWGEVPMPPNAHVSDENIHIIVEWVLGL
jgi:cytochrome c